MHGDNYLLTILLFVTLPIFYFSPKQGGPLYDKEKNKLVGVVSWGFGESNDDCNADMVASSFTMPQ